MFFVIEYLKAAFWASFGAFIMALVAGGSR